MTLKREDFSALTDEQWEQFVSETDRRASEASKTARKNAEQEAERTREAEVAAAVEREREKLTMDEEQRLEARRKEIEAAESKLAQKQRSLTATERLIGAGYTREQVESLLPTFIALDDTTFTGALDTFITTNESIIKAKIDAEKQTLLNNATPPANPTGAPVDMSTKVQEHLAAGNEAAAVDILLAEAGYTAQQ